MDDRVSSQHPAALPGGHELAFKGAKFGIYYVRRRSGRLDAKEYVASLQKSDRAKLLRLLQKLADGHPMKKIEYDMFEGGIWEVKEWGVRVMGFYQGKGRAYLTHGFTKRRNVQAPAAQVEVCRTIRGEFGE